MKRDIRGSLLAKIIAIFLLTLTAAGAALGFLGMIVLGEGYGMADTYAEDKLCTDPMETAMHQALCYFTVGSDSYYSHELITEYQGIYIQIYDGDPVEENLTYSWGNVPGDDSISHTITVEHLPDTTSSTGSTLTHTPSQESTDSTATETEPDASEKLPFYTVVGHLPMTVPYSSVFHMSMRIYDALHPLSRGEIIPVTIVMLLAAVILLIFLLCAAGHRQNEVYVLPNWQDRVPLDLYMCAAGTAFILLLALSAACLQEIGYSFSLATLFLTLFGLCVIGAWMILLATLMTIATRLKLGKWWRNTICYKLLRWCWRLWKGFGHTLADLLHILPFTWRTMALVCGVLVAQTFLTLLMFEIYNGGVFFLVTLALDAVIVVGTAWLTRQMQLLQKTAQALAEGNLDVKADTKKMYFDCRRHAEHLNAIGVGMTRAVEQKIKSERLKTELITNVSHDIKTPLTSIVNYVDLLKKEVLPETAGEYVAVLDRQSRRLKKLTEDLVEASKASTGNMAVKLEPIVVNEIIHQAIGDYNEKLSAGRLDVIVSTYEGSVQAMADGRLLWRVLDNLLNNVCKYALAGTRVYVNLENSNGRVFLSIKNISRDPLNVRPEELTERFVRGDESRHTEGSGLGLNIAQSLMELMGGTFQISVDGDLFKAELSLPTI